MRSPLLALAICFALGIVMARSGPPPFLKDFRLMGILLAAAGACMLFALIAMRGVWLRASWLLTLLGFVFAGTLAAALFESRFAPNHVSHLADLGVDVSRPVRLQGVIVSIPYPTPFGLQFDVEAQNVESRGQTHFTAGKVRLRLETSDDPEMLSARDSLRLQSGDSIRALAQLHRPRSYQNPGSFDLRQWMESIEDLYWVGNIKSPLLIEKLPSASPPVVTGLLDGVRRRALQSIDGLYPPWSRDGRDGAVLKAMLLGDRTSLDSDTIEAFRKTGLYHLLVIAGLHVGLLAGLAAALLRRFRVRETWRAAALLALLFAYAAVVEQRAPTLRATLMICVYLLARWLYRQHAALNAIGLAALVLLLRRPAWLFETGFELSFCAALLIAGLAVPVLLRTTEPYRRGLRRLEEVNLDPSLPPRVAQFRLDVRALIFALKTRSRFLERHPAIAAVFVMSPARLVLWAVNAMLFAGILQLGLLLPMAEDFHRVSFAGIGLNALAIPVMTLVLGIGMPTLVLGAIFPALAAWPAKGLGFLLSWLFALTDWPGLPHWLSFRVANPPPWVAWGFVLSVVLAAWALGRHARVFRTSAATTVVFAALISLHPFAPRIPSGVLEVTALDCGGGAAFFLVFPDRTTMLVDAGSSRTRSTREGAFLGRRWDPGEDIVSPYLWARGIEKIDFLALSQAREDHIGGLAAVVRNFSIGEFWHVDHPLTPSYLALLEEISRRRIPTRELAAGEHRMQGGTSVDTLWPPSGSPPPGLLAPDQPLVLRITDGGASVLLPGDLTSKVESELARAAFPLESRALELARDGPRTSSAAEFLGRVSPQVAVISGAGEAPANLSNPGMLERLRAAGTRVFRTDLDGAVTVEMRGVLLYIYTYGTSGAD